RYASIAAEAGDPDHDSRQTALESALLYHRYGHFDQARAALQPIFEQGCAGEGAWEGGAAAWRALRDIAMRLGRNDTVRSLGDEIEQRHCDFAAGRPSCGPSSDDP